MYCHKHAFPYGKLDVVFLVHLCQKSRILCNFRNIAKLAILTDALQKLLDKRDAKRKALFKNSRAKIVYLTNLYT